MLTSGARRGSGKNRCTAAGFGCRNPGAASTGTNNGSSAPTPARRNNPSAAPASSSGTSSVMTRNSRRRPGDAGVAAAAGAGGVFRVIAKRNVPICYSAGDCQGPRVRKILGLSAYYHDAAAALVVDGRVVAAAQEERFTRKRHDERFPAQAARYLPGVRPSRARRARCGRLLRQAVPEIRASARDLSRLRAARSQVVRRGDAGMDQGEAVPQGGAAARAAHARAGPRAAAAAAVQRAPPVARRVGVLSEPVRGGSRVVPRRRRRVGHGLGLGRIGRAPGATLGAALSALARACSIRPSLRTPASG